MKKKLSASFLFFTFLLLAGCAYNPSFEENNSALSAGTTENTPNQVIPLHDDPLPEGAVLVYAGAEDSLSKSISTSFGSEYVSIEQNSNGVYKMKINFWPSGKTRYKKVLFSVYNDADAAGWTVNIGDSPTVNGWGGDGGSRSNDCELQVLNGTLAVYASEHGGSSQIYSAGGYNVQTGSKNVRYEISNNKIRTWKNFDTANITTISNQNLFALDGRYDSTGNEEYEIYASFNRTYGSSSRSGNGITRIYVYMQEADDFEQIPVSSNYSATLRHLMYKKSVLSSKWYANTDFSGYGYFLNGKNKDNWDEKEKEHIYALEYWTPAAANTKNIVFLAAGQQGILADRQDYPAIVTGQPENWHYYDDAPFGATNTWKYMKNDTTSINRYSLAGQIIADGTLNNGANFGFTPSNTRLILVYDTCFYWGDLSVNEKNALVTDYLEWMFSKVNNNSANALKNIYLAGASRGGALVSQMAYQMRHDQTWKSRTGSARVIVSSFDGVTNQEEGEMWTTSSTKDNPLESILGRRAYISNLPSYFTNTKNTHLLQIAGGANVVPLLTPNKHAFYFNSVTNKLEFRWVNRSHTEIGREWHSDTVLAHLRWLAKWSIK